MMYAQLMLIAILSTGAAADPTDPFGPWCRETSVDPPRTHRLRLEQAVADGCRAPDVLMQLAEYLALAALIDEEKVGCEARTWIREAAVHGMVDDERLSLSAAERVCVFEQIWLRRPDGRPVEAAACEARSSIEVLTFSAPRGGSTPGSPSALTAPARQRHGHLGGICRRDDVRDLQAREAELRGRLFNAGQADVRVIRVQAAEALVKCRNYEDDRVRVRADARQSWLDADALCAALDTLTRAPLPVSRAVGAVPPSSPSTTHDMLPPDAVAGGEPAPWTALLPTANPPQPVRYCSMVVVDRAPLAMGMLASGLAIAGGSLAVAGWGGRGGDLVETGAPLLLMSAGISGAVAIALDMRAPDTRGLPCPARGGD